MQHHASPVVAGTALTAVSHHDVCLLSYPATVSATARQNHTASLSNVSPKGCLKDVINATTAGDEGLASMIGTECFNKLNLVLVNNTGAKGCPDRTFTGTSVNFQSVPYCLGTESGFVCAHSNADVFHL
jgi:hypothetical protein